MYNYTINQKTYQLTQDELTERLTHLSQTTKVSHWIGHDLEVYPSSLIGRFLWIIAKHFTCMRQIFYGIDLEESKSILQQLRPQLQQKDVQTVFNQAVLNFNAIAPRHQVDLLEEKQIDVQPEPKLGESEPIQQKNVFNQVELLEEKQVAVQPEHIQPLQPPEKKLIANVRIEVTQVNYSVNAKIFDADLNKHIGHIEGVIGYRNKPQAGYFFHLNTIGMKEGGYDDKGHGNYIGKGYGTAAFRQFMDGLLTSEDPLLKQVKYYTLVTHRLAPQPVKLFKRAGFEEILVGYPDYDAWLNLYAVNRDTSRVVMMIKQREIPQT